MRRELHSPMASGNRVATPTTRGRHRQGEGAGEVAIQGSQPQDASARTACIFRWRDLPALYKMAPARLCGHRFYLKDHLQQEEQLKVQVLQT